MKRPLITGPQERGSARRSCGGLPFAALCYGKATRKTREDGMTARTLDDTTAGTIRLGDLEVRRLGFGAMRISSARNAEGKIDRAEAVKLSRRVYERGVNFYDAANIYGYGACEEILAEALHPYPKDLLIATKAGYATIRMEPGMKILPANGRPEHIKEACDKSLRRLKIDCIDLYQVHTPDPATPFADTVGAFAELQKAGKCRHIGLSNVTVEQLREAQRICKIVSVQNRYNLGNRASEAVLEACEADGIAFLPFRPVILGDTPAAQVSDEIAKRRGITTQQLAIAWLLQHSRQMLPIPGTSKAVHADQNIDAAWIRLDEAEVRRLDTAEQG
jgi:aryl-alcohol dehydrogenase-like predicted oxidoreductase